MAVKHFVGIVLLALYSLFLLYVGFSHPSKFATDEMEDTQFHNQYRTSVETELETIFSTVTMTYTSTKTLSSYTVVTETYTGATITETLYL